MKEGWLELNIEEISKSIFAGGDVDKSNLSNYRTEEFNIPIYTNGEKNDGLYGFTNIARVTEKAITVSARGTIGFTCIRNEPYYPAVRLINIIPNEKINLNYLCYFIKNKTVLHTGSSIPQLTVPMVKKFKIGIPQKISEQQKIVEKLDTAFALIETVKTNIEKNIQNAKELFQSKLNEVFSQKGDGWEEKKLKDICDDLFAGGDVLKKQHAKYKTDEYQIAIFTNGEKNKGLYGYTNIIRVDKPAITISGRGTIGYTQIRDEPFYPAVRLIVAVPNLNIIKIELMKYFLDSIDFANTGSSIPQLTIPMVKNRLISYPKLTKTQQKIVEQLDQLSAQTELLQEKYKQKLANLEELKKSILEKAFKGELV